MMSEKLRGKVAVVTGSGRGIGRAMAIKLASEGARLVLNDLDVAPAETVREEILALGGEAVACCGSVADAGFADRLISTATGAFGGLDILINNAGYTWDNVIQKMTDEQWDAMLDVHLTAPFRILRAAQPVIRALSQADAEAGRRVVRKVVNISSVSGVFGNAGQANYSAAKAGLLGFTRSMALENGRNWITVNAVAPGIIDTEAVKALPHYARIRENAEKATPIPRIGAVEDVAGAIAFLASEAAGYITGEVLHVTGGRY